MTETKNDTYQAYRELASKQMTETDEHVFKAREILLQECKDKMYS